MVWSSRSSTSPGPKPRKRPDGKCSRASSTHSGNPPSCWTRTSAWCRPTRVSAAHSAFVRREIKGQLIYDLGAGEWDIPKLRELLEKIIPEKTMIEDFEVAARFPKIGERVFRLNARRLERETGLPGMILLTFDDVTED